jgi:hypothetical protein
MTNMGSLAGTSISLEKQRGKNSPILTLRQLKTGHGGTLL